MVHFRLFILIFALFLGGFLCVSQPLQAQPQPEVTAPQGDKKCCLKGETVGKNEKTSELACCKGSKENGKLSDACCRAAGGEPKKINGVEKCCKCKDEKCGQK